MLILPLKGQLVFPNGKLEHIQAGAVISILSYSGATYLYRDLPADERKINARKLSLATVFVASLGREIYDYYKYKNVNAWNEYTRIDGFGDFVTTCLAGMTLTMVIPF
jgi:hypothetical protein